MKPFSDTWNYMFTKITQNTEAKLGKMTIFQPTIIVGLTKTGVFKALGL